MAKNDNIAGVLSPTSGEPSGQHLPAYRMNGPSSPRYQTFGTGPSLSIGKTPVEGTYSSSFPRDKPLLSRLSQGSSYENNPEPVANFSHPGLSSFQPSMTGMSSPSSDSSKIDLPSTQSSQHSQRHKHSPSINSNLGISGQQNPSAVSQQPLLINTQQAQQPSQLTSSHMNQNQTHTPTLSSIASLISPNPEIAGYDTSFGVLEKPISRKDMTPWAHSDEINRPKSADGTLASGTSSSPGYHSRPPSISANITRYTSTPPPPGINISASATQPTQAAVSAAANGAGTGITNLLDVDPQYLFYDMPGSWASMANTPTNAMFSPLTSTFSAAAAAGSSAAKINAEIANATAMKLAALSTVNGRVILDTDVKKFRRKTIAPLDLVDDNSSPVAQSPVSTDFRRGDTDSKTNNKPGVPSKFRDKENTNAFRDDAIATGKVVNQQLVYPSTSMVDRGQLSAQYLNAYTVPLQGLMSPTSWGPGFVFPGGADSASAGKAGYPSGSFRATHGHAQSGDMSKSRNNSKSQKGGERPKSTSSKSGSGTTTGSKGPSPVSSTTTTTTSTTNTAFGETQVDLSLLQDIGGWLKSLRLHKYTDCLKDLKWQELIELSDEDLEARGVNALGARRKMLKVFDQIQEAQKAGNLTSSK